jgi:hypothetical protein
VSNCSADSGGTDETQLATLMALIFAEIAKILLTRGFAAGCLWETGPDLLRFSDETLLQRIGESDVLNELNKSSGVGPI